MADALSRTPSLVMLHFPGFMALCCTIKLLLQAPGVAGSQWGLLGGQVCSAERVSIIQMVELDYLRVVLLVLGRISCKYLVKNEGYNYYILCSCGWSAFLVGIPFLRGRV